MKRFLIIIIAAYLAGYGLIRFTHVQTWEQDGQQYVIFPENNIALYYLYRPLSYLDGMITGMRFHIGPHQ